MKEDFLGVWLLLDNVVCVEDVKKVFVSEVVSDDGGDGEFSKDVEKIVKFYGV